LTPIWEITKKSKIEITLGFVFHANPATRRFSMTRVFTGNKTDSGILTQKTVRNALLSLLAFFIYFSSFSAFPADTEKLYVKKSNSVAIAGDSITGQKLYSKFIEAYFLACRPELNLKVFQIGLPGEDSASFTRRMEADLISLNPDVTTICYGMNDGRYGLFRDDIARSYDESMRKIVSRLKDEKKAFIIGTPPCVDTDTFNSSNKGRTPAAVYNETLRKLGEIGRKIAEDFSCPKAEVHAVMDETMKKAKQSYGNTYHVAGMDGIHPAPNGHLCIAYAFLKAMGFDGNIGIVTVDFQGASTATEGHVVKSSGNGKTEIESMRYPFCFYGQDKDPNGTRSILPFLPFNKDLNRFTLIVKNCPSEKAEVKWGPDKKVFDSKRLEEGINLADEFLNNPFSEKFNQLLSLIDKKQSYETSMTVMISTIGKEFGTDKDIQGAVASIRKRIEEKREKFQEDAASFVTPLTHCIEITPVKQ